jgi:hypothetical protein
MEGSWRSEAPGQTSACSRHALTNGQAIFGQRAESFLGRRGASGRGVSLKATLVQPRVGALNTKPACSNNEAAMIVILSP